MSLAASVKEPQLAARKLRILQVLRAPIGGLYRHVADLSGELTRRGHQLGIVMDSRLEDAQTAQRLAPLMDQLPLGVHRMPIPRLLGPSDLTTPLALRRLARSLDVDILHGHGAKGGFHARLARLGLKRPAAFYTPHGGALHFAPNSLQGRLFDGIEKVLFPLTDGICFESAFAKAIYENRLGTPSCPAPVIHNGLADDEFIAVPLLEDAADFAFVGELRALKGVPVLLEALAGVTAKDGRPATLVIAGDGALRGEIEDRIAKDDLKGRVSLLGVQPARKVFARGRCVVVPSFAESLPYVVLEAIGAGRDLIATDVGGIKEIFGPTAYALIPPNNVEALAAAMQAALDGGATLEAEMRTRSDFVRERFGLFGMSDGVERLYQSALGI